MEKSHTATSIPTCLKPRSPFSLRPVPPLPAPVLVVTPPTPHTKNLLPPTRNLSWVANQSQSRNLSAQIYSLKFVPAFHLLPPTT